MVIFDICQSLATPGPFEYFCQNWVPSGNQSFLNEGGLRGLGEQMTRLHDGTIFGRGATHLMGCQGLSKKIAFFSTFAMP